MPDDILKKVLHSLSCGKFKVLKKIAEGGESGGAAIKTTDSFTFNETFT
jgi:hypothetical protein